MATLEEKINAEIRTRAIVEEGGLPQPDEVEYGYTCIRLLWHEAKLAVVVQIDEPPPGWEFAEELSDTRCRQPLNEFEQEEG